MGKGQGSGAMRGGLGRRRAVLLGAGMVAMRNNRRQQQAQQMQQMQYQSQSQTTYTTTGTGSTTVYATPGSNQAYPGQVTYATQSVSYPQQDYRKMRASKLKTTIIAGLVVLATGIFITVRGTTHEKNATFQIVFGSLTIVLGVALMVVPVFYLYQLSKESRNPGQTAGDAGQGDPNTTAQSEPAVLESVQTAYPPPTGTEGAAPYGGPAPPVAPYPAYPTPQYGGAYANPAFDGQQAAAYPPPTQPWVAPPAGSAPAPYPQAGQPYEQPPPYSYAMAGNVSSIEPDASASTTTPAPYPPYMPANTTPAPYPPGPAPADFTAPPTQTPDIQQVDVKPAEDSNNELIKLDVPSVDTPNASSL